MEDKEFDESWNEDPMFCGDVEEASDSLTTNEDPMFCGDVEEASDSLTTNEDPMFCGDVEEASDSLTTNEDPMFCGDVEEASDSLTTTLPVPRAGASKVLEPLAVSNVGLSKTTATKPPQPDVMIISSDDEEEDSPQVKQEKEMIAERISEGTRLIVYPPHPFSGGIKIYIDDYLRLKRGRFLNDSIIDFYLMYLERNDRNNNKNYWIFSTHFYSVLTKNSGTAVHENVKKWTKNVNIFTKDFVIVPINKNEHWFLAVITQPGMMEAKGSHATKDEPSDSPVQGTSVGGYKKPTITFLDSLPTGTKRKEYENLLNYLRCEWAAKFPETPRDFNEVNFPWVSGKSQNQTNTFDCGIFLLHYVEKILTNPTVDLSNVEKWFPIEEATQKRLVIQGIIHKLMQEQHIEINNLPDLKLSSPVAVKESQDRQIS